MTMRTENLAILLATYNGEKYLAQQLDSVITQSCRDWELFIHDDGSTDSTPAILRKYAAGHPGRIHILEAPPCGGARDNFFYLMSEVDAPYIMFCDQDDVWFPNKIERSLRAMKELERKKGGDVPLLVFSDSTVVDGELRVLDKSFLHYQHLLPGKLRFADLMVQNVVSGNVSLFNRPLRKAALQYTDPRRVIIHDWWCALVAAYFGAIALVDGSTILYRQHGNNAVGAKQYSSLKAVLRNLKRRNEIKGNLYAEQVQAGEFARAFRLGEESLPALYARSMELRHMERRIFYMKYRLKKSGLIRTVGFYLFG